jgi:hypothetical protein
MRTRSGGKVTQALLEAEIKKTLKTKAEHAGEKRKARRLIGF